METNNYIYDIAGIREDFPILKTKIHGKDLVYFDNAATTQKPKMVIDAIAKYYLEMNSNIHRGVHTLSETATREYEAARVKVKNFLNAKDEKEIIFTRGTTESLNLLAYSLSKKKLNEGDEIIISNMEHHSNIVPWQILAEEKKFKIKVIPINDSGELLMDEYEKLFTEKTKLVSVVYVSNSLGTINPVKEIIETAHKHGAEVIIDAAQAVNHIKVNVQELDCDYLVLSGHKLYGPTGIGVLYGKEKLLNELPPFMGGGDMILDVTFEKTTYNTLPYKLEAGTPNIEGVIGFGYAIDYINKLGLDNIFRYEKELLEYGTNKLSEISGLRIIGTAKDKCSILSFVLDDVHPHDVGTFMDFEGVAVRTGHHCTQPIMKRYCIPATTRASIGLYNTKEEIDVLAASIKKIIEVFK